MSTREKSLRLAYDQLLQELSRALYEEDPAMMGSSVSAPTDEYDEQAARLASELRETSSLDEQRTILMRRFGVCPGALLERTNAVVAAYRAAVASVGEKGRR